ncbi:hypothetical protein ACFQZZ_31360 [Nocardia sp. GCM10030253]|uniref:hypothetical protein n=1 Tax=Nocardia sp. GCM10030253 TaxID=3273404 RepID=UPI0036311AFE
MVRSRYPTEDELRRNFERELASVSSGGGLRSETGLDIETDAALIEIAKAHPNVPETLVTAARAAFAGQLDGSNAMTRRTELKRMLAEHNRRKGPDSPR